MTSCCPQTNTVLITREVNWNWPKLCNRDQAINTIKYKEEPITLWKHPAKVRIALLPSAWLKVRWPVTLELVCGSLKPLLQLLEPWLQCAVHSKTGRTGKYIKTKRTKTELCCAVPPHKVRLKGRRGCERLVMTQVWHLYSVVTRPRQKLSLYVDVCYLL